ncbi:hypothetical protein [Haloarchaeobius sp. HME9146]|uniref:hypothetical protein n=1 Tax=Haloarchaeobius sp. HME9146 TaxID=2978732 RepID=UPI0021BE13A9|nr:hypothetical protein [Haloarchaeobius sp. HME9146]MCT9096870.1 hypothetical protein [Haloarchaeobius sp. HME9146]
MSDVFPLVLSVFFVPHLLNSAGRLLDTAIVVWAVSVRTPADLGTASEGEPVAVEGTVVVDEPAWEARRVVGPAGRPVGAYLWRTTSQSRGENTIDFDSWTVQAARSTQDSGLEHGRFSIRTGTEPVRVDPSWLQEQYDTGRLAAIQSGKNVWIRFRHSLWNAPAVHMTADETTRPLDQLVDLFENVDTDGLEDHELDSVPVRDGDTIAVFGRLGVEDGEHVVRGGDGLPFVLSDQGFDGVQQYLRRRLLKHGFGVAVPIVAIVAIWTYL